MSWRLLWGKSLPRTLVAWSRPSPRWKESMTIAKKVKDLKDLEIEYSNGQVFINKEKVSTKTEVDNLVTLVVKSGKLKENCYRSH